MNIEAARAQMLHQQIRAGDVLDGKVLDTLGKIPRELFVPEAYSEVAFADAPIPLGHGQSMMLPQIEGRILQAVQLSSIDKVLEIGTGSGFLTACLADLCDHVRSIDIFEDFISAAQIRFNEQRITNVFATAGDAMSTTFDEQYDVVVLTASLPELDDRFTGLLRNGGRMFAVVGRAPVMEAQLITRLADSTLSVEGLFETILTPMINGSPNPPFEL